MKSHDQQMLSIAASHITALRCSLQACIGELELSRRRDMANHPKFTRWIRGGESQLSLERAKQVLRPEWPPSKKN